MINITWSGGVYKPPSLESALEVIACPASKRLLGPGDKTAGHLFSAIRCPLLLGDLINPVIRDPKRISLWSLHSERSNSPKKGAFAREAEGVDPMASGGGGSGETNNPRFLTNQKATLLFTLGSIKKAHVVRILT